jgi:osmotically-inducible protein OsmY
MSRAGPTAAQPTDYPPDNTGRNLRDKDGATLTPQDQSTADQDVSVTQRLRKLLADDSALSIEAQNIKIVTVAGIVTLRGPVKSQEERATIQKAAEAVAGVKHVDNQLEVDSE